MTKNFNLPQVVEYYDEHIQQLIPGYTLVHLHLQAILDNLFKEKDASQINILIAGCGTGYELRYLVEQFPQATFVAFDPSKAMIEKCQSYFLQHHMENKVQLICGDSSVLNNFENNFDAVLCILVSHFLETKQKQNLLNDLYSSLKEKGCYLSYDLMKFQNQSQISEMLYMTKHLGLTEKQSSRVALSLEEDFHLISVDDYQQMLKNIGFCKSECFMKISNFYGMHAIK